MVYSARVDGIDDRSGSSSCHIEYLPITIGSDSVAAAVGVEVGGSTVFQIDSIGVGTRTHRQCTEQSIELTVGKIGIPHTNFFDTVCSCDIETL